MNGLIRLTRSALTDDMWRNDGLLLRVYMYLLRQSDDGVASVSVAQIVKATGLTERRVRNALEALEKSGRTSSERSNKGSMVTLCQSAPIGTSTSSKRSNRTSSRKTARFIPPTDEEVAAYVTEKGYHFNPAQFVPHYQKKGWMVGKSPMVDWRAACRTWEISWKEKHGTRFYYEIQQSTIPDNASTRAQSRNRLRSLASGVLSQSTDKLLSLYNGGGTGPDARQD